MSKKITMPDLIRMHQQHEKIVMLTAYDHTMAKLIDAAGVDLILVGDSLGTVVQGKENTLEVTVDEMLYHTKMVARAACSALVVADMPFMSYQAGPRDALLSAGRLIKEGGAAAVKLEGGTHIVESIRRITEVGIPVMGHVGLTPQSYHQMGGYRVQGRTENEAQKILADAQALEKAGVFSVVLEGIPAELAEKITASLSIPTIGIGAGSQCSGQVLVVHDLLGLSLFEDGGKPKFIKEYAALGGEIARAVETYVQEVRDQIFPGSEHEYHGSKGS